MWLRPRSAIALGLVALLGCGSEETLPAPPHGDAGPAEGCVPGELKLEDGTCLRAGMQTNGCAAGEVAMESGGCRAAGIPPDACAAGFETDGNQGCAPVLPASPCPAGKMAIPGETSCRAVATCGAAPWGDIPVEPSTQYVDATYAGGNSDGTAGHPWTSIGEAVIAAEPGAIVAVAAGSYAENVVLSDAPVRIWGRCPELVEIVGQSGRAAAVVIQAAAAGTEVRSLAIRGVVDGILAPQAHDVVLDRLWIHDVSGRGVDAEFGGGDPGFVLRRSLVEHAREVGVFVADTTGTIEESVVRDTQPAGPGQPYGVGVAIEGGARATVTASLVERSHDVGVLVDQSEGDFGGSVVRDTQPSAADAKGGRGIVIQADPSTGQRSKGAIHGCYVARNHDLGVFIKGSDATIDASVVRDTQPRASDDTLGFGISIERDPKARERALASVTSSVVAGNHDSGIYVNGSDVTIEATVVRDMQPRASDMELGRGIEIGSAGAGERSNGKIVGSVVERALETGVMVSASDVTVDGLMIRGTQPQASDGLGGRGLDLQPDSEFGGRSNGTVRSSILEQNREVGLFVEGSDVTFEASIVRQTEGRASDGIFGFGATIQASSMFPERAKATLRGSIIEDARDCGLAVFDSEAVIEGTLVQRTMPTSSAGDFGDGIAAITSVEGTTTVSLSESRIEASARSGVTSFGATVSVRSTVLECNPIHIDGEPSGDASPSFDDLGDNVCGCAGEVVACTMLSSTLEAPAPAAASH